jgi:hypothetical protein
MGHNLFIHYLLDPKTSEASIVRAVSSLGNSTPIFPGLWYVNGIEDAKEALKRVSSWMTDKDRLVVVDAANNECLWFNMDEKLAQRIRQNWRMDISKDAKSKAATPH